jgi:hypothetical protein
MKIGDLIVLDDKELLVLNIDNKYHHLYYFEKIFSKDYESYQFRGLKAPNDMIYSDSNDIIPECNLIDVSPDVFSIEKLIDLSASCSDDWGSDSKEAIFANDIILYVYPQISDIHIILFMNNWKSILVDGRINNLLENDI